MRARHLVIISLLIGGPTIASAQQVAADSMPDAGTWGAEINVGSGATGANLIRFQSRKLALVLGADFSVDHTKVEQNVPLVGTLTSKTTQTAVGARLGVRTYRESGSEKLRPLFGFGVRSGYGKSGAYTNWTAGAYGELGATYFLTPHVSLGGSGELQANYGKLKQPNGTGTITRIDGSLMRVVLGVYF